MLKNDDRRALVGLGLMPLAFIGVLAIFWLSGGADALPWRQLESNVAWQGSFTWPWRAWARTALALVGVLPVRIPTITVAANWVLTALFYALLIRSTRRDTIPYALFAWCAHLMTASRLVSDATLQSMPRYVLVLFPAFVVLAIIGERRAWFNRTYVYTCALLWLVFATMFALWYWIA